MWRSSLRRVSNLFLNVSSFFLSMIAAHCYCYDCSLPRSRSRDLQGPFRLKSNKYPKRGRDRASTGRGDRDQRHSSRLVRLAERGRGVLGKFLLGGLRALDLQLVEQKRGAGDAEPDGLRAILDLGRGSGRDEIAPQGADVEITEDASANEFFVRIFGPDAIEEPRLEARAHGFHVESVGQITTLAEFDQLCLKAGVGLWIG